MEKLKGFIPPVNTAFTPEGQFDEQGQRRLIQHVIGGGANGVFVLGSMGEGYATPSEIKPRLIEVASDEIRGRVPLLAGIADTSTRAQIRNASMAKKAGADVVVAMCTIGTVIQTQENVFEHFKMIADQSQLPVVFYDNPFVTGRGIEIDTMLRLAEHPNVVALKDSTCDFPHFSKLVRALGRSTRFGLFQGDECVLDASVLMGASGFVAGIGNVAPRICAQLYGAASQGNREKATELQAQVMRLLEMYQDTPFAACKKALELMGLCGGYCLPPNFAVTREHAAFIERILRQEGLLG